MTLEELKNAGFTAIDIPLTQKMWAIIDLDDAPIVLPHRWCSFKSGETFYAGTNKRRQVPAPNGRKYDFIVLHRELFGLTDPSQEVDHRNGNGLNNRRGNLRLCTSLGNNQNQRHMKRNNKSGFKGVSFDRERGTWKAQIKCNGRKINLGRFATPEEAAQAYDRAAQRMFGEFAAPNQFIIPGSST